MHAFRAYSSLAVIGAALVLLPAGAFAQASPVVTHVGHVRSAFGQTPNGEGLLPTAMAEAQVAIQHAGLAARDLSNLDAMKLHTTHVVNAVDPSVVAQGPGLGFGVKRAAEGVAQHIGLAANSDGASQNVATHSAHITASAETVVARSDEILALAAQIAAANTAEAAAPLVQELQTLTTQLVEGEDANGDGRVSWEAGEGGLQQADQHLGFLASGEGITE